MPDPALMSDPIAWAVGGGSGGVTLGFLIYKLIDMLKTRRNGNDSKSSGSATNEIINMKLDSQVKCMDKIEEHLGDIKSSMGDMAREQSITNKFLINTVRRENRD